MLPRIGRCCVAWLGDLLAPAVCGLCDAPSSRSPCASCLAALPPRPPPRLLAGVPLLAPSLYAEPVRGAVRRLKYEGRVDVIPTLARLVAPLADALPPRRDVCLLPVPLHHERLAERGFNQAALLARAVAGEWRSSPGAPRATVVTRALVRTHATGHQARRTRIERLAAMNDAFAIRHSGQLSGCQVVLCDDVVTTGATASACIVALRRAGATVVAVLAACVADGSGADSGG